MQAKESSILSPTRIRIVGLGGAGVSIVSRVAEGWPDGPACLGIDTDGQVLTQSGLGDRLQIGSQLTGGQGTGGNPVTGTAAAENDRTTLRERVTGRDLVLAACGLGGGTGTGSAPVVLRLAKEAGARTLCFCTLPFEYEGKGRRVTAERGLAVLRQNADVVVCVPGRKLFAAVAGATAVGDAFEGAERIVAAGIVALARLFVRRGLINLDFADVSAVAQRGNGVCLFGYGEGAGSDRIDLATRSLLEGDMLDSGRLLSEAPAVLVSILGGADLTFQELDDIMAAVSGLLADEADVFVGATVDDAYQGRVAISVLVPFAAAAGSGVSDAAPVEATAAVVEQTQARTSIQRSTAKQTRLQFVDEAKGRFKDVAPTVHDGEDLDIPTYKRRGLKIRPGTT